jgi:hypothetical protein
MHGHNEPPAEQRSSRLIAQINEFDLRLTTGRRLNGIRFSLGIHVRLKRWMRGCKHDERTLNLGPHTGYVSSMITRLLRLLEGWIIFSIHPDQSDRAKRRKDCGACPNDNRGGLILSLLPSVGPWGSMEKGNRKFGEGRKKSSQPFGSRHLAGKDNN